MRQSPRRASLPHRRRRQVAPPAVEVLERREVLSLIFDFGHDADHHHEEDMIGPPSAELKSADARPVGGSSGPQIRLELVALHEFGHSLGLDHNDKDGPSIMNSYYNPNYDLNSFPRRPRHQYPDQALCERQHESLERRLGQRQRGDRRRRRLDLQLHP